MDDLEKRNIYKYNKCGIDESIDISEIGDGEIRPLDISEMDMIKPLKKNKLKSKDKYHFVNLLLTYVEKISQIIHKIKNSKNPEMIIIMNIIFGIFFHLLSDPPILINQINYYFIEEILGYLRTSIFMIFLSSLFFSLIYLQIYFMRNEINKYLLILPLLIQFSLFIFSENELNKKINFGIYRKFFLIIFSTTLFFIGFFF